MNRVIRLKGHAFATAIAAGAMFGAAALIAFAPAAVADVPSTGVWIFPHANRAAVLAGTLSPSMYTGDSENLVLMNSFIADSTQDAADIMVDLYNPTSSDLYNVQVFASYAVGDLSLVSSIRFSGGDSGDLAYSGSDLESGGTPQMAGGVAIDAHDVYPAYFVSYGVGSLPAGASNLRSFTIEVAGDFASGLVVHMDYTAEDADGNGVSGPFEADMNIFDNGEPEEPPTCTAPSVTLTAVRFDRAPLPGSDFRVTFAVGTSGSDDPVTGREIRAQMEATSIVSGGVIGEDSVANVYDDDEGTPLTLTLPLPRELVAGDIVNITATLIGTACGEPVRASTSFEVSVGGAATGNAHTAAWWAEQMEKAAKGKKKGAFTGPEFDGFLQTIALHSSVFTYGAWNGTAPTGAADDGWVDIDSLSEALKVLDKKTGESKKVRGAEMQDLALWLNVASGAVNLNTPLEIFEKKHHLRGAHSEFGDHTGQASLASSYDTPAEILAFLEHQIKDWQDGQGASKASLKLARRLASSVNHEWLVAA